MSPNGPREMLLRLVAAGLPFSPTVYSKRPCAGVNDEFPSELSRILGGKYHGPVKDIIPDTLFVMACMNDSHALPNLARTGMDQLNIVSSLMKEIIESFSPKKSEFLPASVVVYSDDSLQDGTILENSYWLWHHYNWLDLIDDEASQ